MTRFQSSIKRLITGARKSGSVTLAQLNKALPDDASSPEQIEEAMAMIEDAGLKLVERKSDGKKGDAEDQFDDDDDFFGGGFGSMGGSMQFQSSSFGGSHGGGMQGSSVSQQTYMEGGKQVTRTEKTTVDASGNKTTEVTESTDDGRGNRSSNTYMI